ncbi:MAG: hypothetical protein RBT76_15570 [candidate division Zixibacteria bacterium]|jgi:hypothetical protein|nr:hypothetical protein [candidate division Zixibacteria bacterium]
MKTNIPAAKAGSTAPRSAEDSERANELARTIAQAFLDTDNLATYQILCRKYSDSGVKAAYRAALSVPDEKVKRSRLALFTFLVKKYAADTK